MRVPTSARGLQGVSACAQLEQPQTLPGLPASSARGSVDSLVTPRPSAPPPEGHHHSACPPAMFGTSDKRLETVGLAGRVT